MAYYYKVIFFLRRYLMLGILTLLPINELLQIQVQMLSTIWVIAYLWHTRPYKSNLLNNTETLNEFTVLVAAYPLLGFTEWMSLHES